MYLDNRRDERHQLLRRLCSLNLECLRIPTAKKMTNDMVNKASDYQCSVQIVTALKNFTIMQYRCQTRGLFTSFRDN